MPALTFNGTGFYPRGRRRGGGGVVGGWWGLLLVLSVTLSPLHTLFLCFHLSYHVQVWEGKQWCMLLSLCFLTHFNSAGGALVIGRISLCSTPRWCHSLIQGPVNPVHSNSLSYSPGLLLGLPNY